MNFSNLTAVVICGVIVIACGVALFASRQNVVDQTSPPVTRSDTGDDRAAPADPTSVASSNATGSTGDVGDEVNDEGDPNKTAPPTPDWLVDGKRPERLAGLTANPPPFNRDEYIANPQKYLQSIDPGRVYQSLDPAPNVPVLRLDGQDFHDMIQGESVFLRVIAEPNMPVTFLTPRFGQFENRLRTITVAADETGLASAKYTATSGTHGIVDITAASPTSSGEVSFRLRVVLPNKTSSK